MIKIEKEYKATSFFSDDKSNSWDRTHTKVFKVSIFGLTIFKRTQTLDCDWEEVETKKVGFKG
jgi:hypothetical protein